MRAGGSVPRPIRGVSAALRLATRALRQRETRAERALWESLRDRWLDGLRFRRQHAIGTFVLDFYFPTHVLRDWEQERRPGMPQFPARLGIKAMVSRRTVVM